jgi:hypothetical protein
VEKGNSKQRATVTPVGGTVGQSLGNGLPEEPSRVTSSMRPISPGTNRISTTTTMMNQRTQRGAPPDTCLDHELVKLDHRASSCSRATRVFLSRIPPHGGIIGRGVDLGKDRRAREAGHATGTYI